MRSQVIGDPALKNDFFIVNASAKINGEIAPTLTTITIDQQVKLMGFPEKAKTHVSFCQLWVIPRANRTLADQAVYVAVIPANEDEDVISGAEFFSRWIDLMVINMVFGDETGFTETIHEGRQIWIDETFDSKLDQGNDGLYVYAQNTDANDLPVRIIARMHVEYELEQRYLSDAYSRKGRHISEGWNGYEWEESGYHELAEFCDGDN